MTDHPTMTDVLTLTVTLNRTERVCLSGGLLGVLCSPSATWTGWQTTPEWTSPTLNTDETTFGAFSGIVLTLYEGNGLHRPRLLIRLIDKRHYCSMRHGVTAYVIKQVIT